MTESSRRGYIDPISVNFSKNVDSLLGSLGWTAEDLAKLVGCSGSVVRKCIAIGFSAEPESKRWDGALLHRAAKALGTTVEKLADAVPLETQTDSLVFNAARYKDPQVLLDRFAEHETPTVKFWTFDRLPACPWMTEVVQRKLHLSTFAALSGSKTGAAIVEAWNKWGDARREKYLAREREDMPERMTFMLRSDFEGLVYQKRPFDLCRPEEVAACLEYMRSRCVIERGFRLVLIDDHQMERDADLKSALGPLVALAVMGNDFGFRKQDDHTVVCSEKRDDIAETLRTLRRLQALRTYDPEEKDVLTELEKYQRQIDHQLTSNQQTDFVRDEDGAVRLVQRVYGPTVGKSKRI